jgi:CHAT domain-containing protein
VTKSTSISLRNALTYGLRSIFGRIDNFGQAKMAAGAATAEGGKLRVKCLVSLSFAISSLAFPLAADAQSLRPSLADSFRLGSGGGVLCQVQVRSKDAALKSMFDRAWSIVCRDAARPVGRMYALNGTKDEVLARLAAARAADVSCNSSYSENVKQVGPVRIEQCTLTEANVGYRVLSAARGKTIWVAEGLGGYDSALRLGLQTIMADSNVAGQVTVATTSVDDPAAFARVQAGTLDADKALAEGYRRNNSGNYAEAAEFFDTLQQRVDGKSADPERLGEYIVNRALQKSNLGEFEEAEALFAEARKAPTVDRVQTRLRRNFEAMHLLNQRRYDEATARLLKPVAANAAMSRLPGSAIEIGVEVAAEINAGLPVAQRLGASDSTALTPEERSQFLDDQALQLRGTLLRLKGQAKDALPLLQQAADDTLRIREGRVVSVIRMRSEILAEHGLALEATGNIAGAEARLRDSLALLELRYPQTLAVNGARARLGSFLARNNKSADALILYKQVVTTAAENRASTTGLGNLLSPYFSLLSGQVATTPTAVDDMFLASQTLVRPGVADTQAILARELSNGQGEGARLFRQARTLDRDIERSRIDLANLTATPQRNADIERAIVAVQSDIETLTKEQATTQARLADFPQFRAISTNALTLPELRATLKPGEAYLKTLVAGRAIYAIFATSNSATGYRIPLSADELEALVTGIRDTISKDENGQPTTYPFDIGLARKLYVNLFGPAADKMAGVKHLIFEPDGALLKLPINLLVTDQASVTAYQARIAKPDADQFDFSGTAWLGRKTAVSTAVSARAFRDARAAPPSDAAQQYLGFGQNAPVGNAVRASLTRSANATAAVGCDWPTSEWNKPVSAEELRQAQAIIGAGQSNIVTGKDFTDLAVMKRSDLQDFRILHFATHGLVTAPRAACPAQPALLTSFGGSGSDGLLTFKEIYDLKLNADIVILSACDTAGKASISATRQAGITTGGGSALDGLVRAFIGAGGRSVLASHWPAPDDFKATERLIGGLFQSAGGTSVGEALAAAQVALMDDPATSHPYYWSGFAVVGDGSRALLKAH